MKDLSISLLVCHMTKKGISAIFGPQSLKNNEIVQSIAESLELPQFQTFWNPKLSTYTNQISTMERTTQIFNLYPDYHLMAKGLATIMRHTRWKSYAIIYENDDGLFKLQDILKMHKIDDVPTLMKRLPSGYDYRHILKEIKESLELHIILDCHVDRILNVLEQAREIKLMEDYYSWFITALDAHTLDLSEFRYTGTNITAIRLLNTSSPHLRNAVGDWVLGEKYQHNYINVAPETVTVSNILIKLIT